LLNFTKIVIYIIIVGVALTVLTLFYSYNQQQKAQLFSRRFI